MKHTQQVPVTAKDSVTANENIKAKQVRLIHKEENRVMGITEARYIANQEQLDLIIVNHGQIPVCKLVNLNKYLYEQKQRAKEMQRSARESRVEVKEIQLSAEIGDHDLAVKLNKAKEFIEDGKQLRLVMALRGRANENALMQDLAKQKISAFVTELGFEPSGIQLVDGRRGKQFTGTFIKKTK